MCEDIRTKDHKHRRRRVIRSVDVLDKKFKRTRLCVAKPSYLISLLERSSTRSNYLKRLPKILLELLRQRNWREASGVLSVLMQGTMRDGSPTMNRLKYEVLFCFVCCCLCLFLTCSCFRFCVLYFVLLLLMSISYTFIVSAFELLFFCCKLQR